MSVEKSIIEFKSRDPKNIQSDTAFANTFYLDYGSMETSISPDSITTYYNKLGVAHVYKALLNHKNATISYFNRGNQLIEEIKFEKDKIDLIYKDKADVFVIYRGWLELQRCKILEHLKNIRLEIKDLNTRNNTQSRFASQNNYYKNSLSYTNQLFNFVEYQINYLISPSERFVSEVLKENYELLSNQGTQTVFTTGNKYYELTDPRGNVMAVVTDKKLAYSVDGKTIDHYVPDVIAATDYSSFGSPLEGRTYNSYKYPYGLNGQEKSIELEPNGNLTTAEFWEYDARTGRRWNVYPKFQTYPSQSPYVAFNENPILYNDPTGESGEVTINKQSKTLTIRSNLVLYGGSASVALAKSTAKDIQDKWNAAGGKIKIDGVQYKVKIIVHGSFNSKLNVDNISMNKDIKNNYIRVEETVKGNISYMDAAGSNTGYFKRDNIKAAGSTTEAHEFGHGFGEDHPANLDIRGKGQPGIMYPRGALVDPPYQYDPKAVVGGPGGTIDPEKRKVTQIDIDNLGLDKLKFDKNGKANLGKITNTYHEKT